MGKNSGSSTAGTGAIAVSTSNSGPNYPPTVGGMVRHGSARTTRAASPCRPLQHAQSFPAPAPSPPPQGWNPATFPSRVSGTGTGPAYVPAVTFDYRYFGVPQRLVTAGSGQYAPFGGIYGGSNWCVTHSGRRRRGHVRRLLVSPTPRVQDVRVLDPVVPAGELSIEGPMHGMHNCYCAPETRWLCKTPDTRP